ncbi:hypothetical protein B4U79_15937, partial [Dinothrombium tinctorium]
MVVTYSNEVLRLVIAQICQNIGWNGIGNQSLEILIEVCRRYIEELGKVTTAFANQYNRVEPTLDDLACAFSQLDIRLSDLEDYFNNVDPVNFARSDPPRLPVASRAASRLTFPDPSEIETRAEYYEEWLPSL